MLPALLKKLLSASRGNLIAIGELADEANGGHMAEFLRTSQEKLDSALAADTRDAVLEMMKQVAYNGTQLRIVIEILSELEGNVEACAEIERRWAARGGEAGQRPDLRDVVVGATGIAPTFASSTAPLRKLYIQALRGSYAPEIFTFAYGPELLDALVKFRLIPSDIDLLADLKRRGDKELALNAAPLADLANYERLASGDFVELMQLGPIARPLFIRHRTEAVDPKIKVRITHRGRLLLTMLTAGRGETER